MHLSLEPNIIATNNLEVLNAGSSIAFIKKLNPNSRIDCKILPMDSAQQINFYLKQSELGKCNNNQLRDHVQVAIAHFSPQFISEVWSYIHDKLTSKGTRIIDLVEKDIKEVFTIEGWLKNVSLVVEEIIEKYVHEWCVGKEKMLSIYDASKDRPTNKILEDFGVYYDLIKLGENDVIDKFTRRGVQSIEKHISGGFATSRLMILQSLAVLPKVYALVFNKIPTSAEMVKLVAGTKSLILTISAADMPVLVSIQKNLFNDSGENFDPNKFWISELNGNLHLEIKPAVLDAIKNFIDKELKQHQRTGCHALLAEGVNGNNVVSEMYDWLAEDFKKFYESTTGLF